MSNAFSILNWCITNTAVLTAASPTYAAWFLRFTDILGYTEEHDSNANEVTTGHAYQKGLDKGVLIREMFITGNAWDAYFTSINDSGRALLYRFTASPLEKMTDTRLLFKAKQMVKDNTPQ